MRWAAALGAAPVDVHQSWCCGHRLVPHRGAEKQMQPITGIAFEDKEQPAKLDSARRGVGRVKNHTLRHLHQLPPERRRLDRSREGLCLGALQREQPV
eukprot:scaffold2782_cov112-Isochrysis_galbana.AAC.4